MRNMNDLMRQLVDCLPAATPSEGSTEDSAASLPPMETPAAVSLPPMETLVPSYAALFPSIPAGFVRATPPEPTPEHRPPTPEGHHPPTPEEHRPPPPEETRRTNALAHWGRTPLSGREYEAHAAPIVPEFKDHFKDIANPRFGANWKTDLDPAKLGRGSCGSKGV